MTNYSDFDKIWSKMVKKDDFEKGDIEYDFIRAEFYKDFDELAQVGVKPDDVHWQVTSYLAYISQIQPQFTIFNPLPNLYKIFNRLTYKTATGIKYIPLTSSNINWPNKLRYATLYQNEQQQYKLDPHRFLIDLEKLTNHRMSCIYNAKVTNSLSLDALEEITDSGLYNSNGQFYNATKQPVPLVEGPRCFATDASNCIGFLHDCILNTDNSTLPECIKHFENLTGSQFDIIRQKIAEMHPSIAIKILKTFGFKKDEVYSKDLGRTIYQVQEVHDWLNRLNDNDIAKNARSRTNLLRYLNLLVQYINRNVGILNKGLDPNSRKLVNTPVSYYAAGFGIKPRYEPMDPEAHAEWIRRRTIVHNKNNNGPVITPFGVPYMQMTGMQLGGFYGTPSVTHTIIGYSNPNTGSAFIKKQLEITINELSKRGKRIDPDVIAQINKDIKSMEDYQNQVLVMIKLIDEYKKMLDVNQDYKLDFITAENLRRLQNKENKIANNIATISKRVMDCVSKLDNGDISQKTLYDL